MAGGCCHNITNDINRSPWYDVMVSKYDTTNIESIIFIIVHIKVLKPSGYRPGIKNIKCL